MSEWSEYRLGDVATVFDGPHATPKKTTDGPWYLSISSLKRGRFDFSLSAHLSEEDFPKWTKRVAPEPGDTVFSYETRIGDAAHWGFDDRAALGRRMGLLRPNRDLINPRFLTHAYLSPQFQELIRMKTVHGATVERLLIAEMPEWPIALPPLDDQRRIASVLGAFDDLIETNQRATSSLRSHASSVYERAVEDGHLIPFGDVASLVRDGVKPEELTPNTPYVGLEHFGTEGSGLNGVGNTAGIDSSKVRFVAGDILYGKLRPYFRKYDRPGYDGVCSTEIWVLRPRDRWGPATLNALVARPEFTNFAMAGSGGTRMPRANWKHVVTMPVPVPPDGKVDEVERCLNELWEAQVGLHEEIANLTRTRDELLPLLMSGKVRVEDVEIPEGAV